MKIFGFKFFNEKRFVHVISNVLIIGVICLVTAVSFISPYVSASVPHANGAIYRGNANNKNITLMINVYWGTEYLEPMLEILKEQDVKTTFFIGGTWADKNNELLLKMYNEGHEIGSHGYYHKDHAKMTLAQNRDEMYPVHALIKGILGIDMTLFAPPSGSFNSTTIEVANGLGYKTIMWSKDTVDWRDKNRTIIFNRATQKLANGDLILMHPTEKTLEALKDIIISIKTQGFNLTTVSQNIAE